MNHHIELQGSQLKALLLQSEEPVDRVTATACRLCNDWETNIENPKHDSNRSFLHGGQLTRPYGTRNRFRRHLGRHMEQLALFALPMAEDTVEDDSPIEENDSPSEENDNPSEEDDDKQTVTNIDSSNSFPPPPLATSEPSYTRDRRRDERFPHRRGMEDNPSEEDNDKQTVTNIDSSNSFPPIPVATPEPSYTRDRRRDERFPHRRGMEDERFRTADFTSPRDRDRGDQLYDRGSLSAYDPRDRDRGDKSSTTSSFETSMVIEPNDYEDWYRGVE
jgi:hypothetical protein